MKIYDTIIIGSGPAGLSAAVYAKRADFDFILIEKEYLGTGQIAESERVDNYLGLYGENGFDLGEKFRGHAEALGTEFVTGEVTAIAPQDNLYNITLSEGTLYTAKTIVYAAGASHRRLTVKGGEEFSGRGVSYCAVCDGAFYKGRTVAVIGGGDTALGEAEYLAKVAAKVYIIHRRDKFRANKTLCRRVENTSNIEIIYNAVPAEISGDKHVESLRISRDGQEETLDVNGIFAALGTVPNSAILRDIVQLNDSGYIIAGEDCVTSAQGIFAAGDVRAKPLRQLVTAAADGANSIYSLEKYLENK